MDNAAARRILAAHGIAPLPERRPRVDRYVVVGRYLSDSAEAFRHPFPTLAEARRDAAAQVKGERIEALRLSVVEINEIADESVSRESWCWSDDRGWVHFA